MPNKIPYTIELLVDDSKLRQTMADLDWEKILGSKKGATGLTEALKNGTEEGVKYAKQILGGLNVNWSEILGAEGLKQFEKVVATSLTKNKNALQKMINANDGKGIEEIIGKVIELGEFLTNLGSAFDSKRLVQNLGTFLTTLGKADSVMSNVIERTQGITSAFGGIQQEVNATTSIIVKLEDIFDKLDVDTSKLDKVSAKIKAWKESFTEEPYEFEGSFDLGNEHEIKNEFEKILGWIDAVQAEIDSLQEKAVEGIYFETDEKDLKEKREELGRFYLYLYDINQLAQEKGMGSLFDPKDTVTSVEQIEDRLSKIFDDLEKNANQIIAGLSTIKIDLSLPEYQKFVPKINAFVDELNKHTNEFNKVNLIPTISPNVDTSVLTSQGEGTKPKQRKLSTNEKGRIKDVQRQVSDEIERLKTEKEALEGELSKAKAKYESSVDKLGRHKGALEKPVLRLTETISQYKKAIASLQQFKGTLDQNDEMAVMTASEWSRNEERIKRLRAQRDQILADTKDWKRKMSDALSFKTDDFTFDLTSVNPGEQLYEAIVDYFDEHPMKLPIDVEDLVEQLQLAFEKSGISLNVGGTAALDASAMMEYLFGSPMPTTPSTTSITAETSASPSEASSDYTKALAAAELKVKQATQERVKSELEAKKATDERAQTEAKAIQAAQDKKAAEDHLNPTRAAIQQAKADNLTYQKQQFDAKADKKVAYKEAKEAAKFEDETRQIADENQRKAMETAAQGVETTERLHRKVVEAKTEAQAALDAGEPWRNPAEWERIKYEKEQEAESARKRGATAKIAEELNDGVYDRLLEREAQLEGKIAVATTKITSAKSQLNNQIEAEKQAHEKLVAKQEAEALAKKELAQLRAQQPKQYVQAIDAMPKSVDTLVDTIKQFAKISKSGLNKDGSTKHVAKGIGTIRDWLEAKGIKVSEITDETSADAIKQMIQNALLTLTQDGSTSGSMLADALKQIITDKSKGISTLGEENKEIITNLQQNIYDFLGDSGINQETWDAWWKRQTAIELSEEALDAGKALSALTTVRGKRSGKGIPSLANIQNAIDIFTTQGRDTTDLFKLKAAREALGDVDKASEDDIAQFREAKAEFFANTKKLIVTLNQLFGDFQGRIEIAGQTYDIDARADGALRKVGMLPNGQITNAEIYRYLEGKALDSSISGSTQYRDRNWRKARRQEERWLKGDEYTFGKASYLSPQPKDFNRGKVDILKLEAEVVDFTTLEERDGKHSQSTAELDELSKTHGDAAKNAKDQITVNNKRIDQIHTELTTQEDKIQQAKQAVAQVASQHRALVDVADLTKAQYDKSSQVKAVNSLERILQTVHLRSFELPEQEITDIVQKLQQRAQLEIKSRSASQWEADDNRAKLEALQRELPEYSTQIVEQMKQINSTIVIRGKVQNTLHKLEAMTVEEAQQQLSNIEKENKKADMLRGKAPSELTQEEQNWLTEFDSNKVRPHLQSLYNEFIQSNGAESFFTTLAPQYLEGLTQNIRSQMLQLANIVKGEAAQIPEADKHIEQAVQAVIQRFKTTFETLHDEIGTLYDEAQKTNDPVVISKLQDVLKYYEQLEIQYQQITQGLPNAMRSGVPKVSEFLPQGGTWAINDVKRKYLDETASVVDERNNAVKQAEIERQALQLEKEALENKNQELATQQALAEKNYAIFEQRKVINALLEQQVDFQTKLHNLQANDAENPAIETLKTQLEDVNKQLDEARKKLQALGGVETGSQISQSDKKNYAQRQAETLYSNLTLLRQQQVESARQRSKVQSDLNAYNKFGLSSKVGRKKLREKENKLVATYMNSDYVKYEIDQARTQAIYEVLNELEDVSIEKKKGIKTTFRQKVTAAMNAKGLDIYNEDVTYEFLAHNAEGQMLAQSFEEELAAVDQVKAELLRDRITELTQSRSSKLKEDFIQSFKNSDYQTAVFQSLDEQGRWTVESRLVNLRETIKTELMEQLVELDDKFNPTDLKKRIEHVEAQLKAAIEYGGLDSRQFEAKTHGRQQTQGSQQGSPTAQSKVGSTQGVIIGAIKEALANVQIDTSKLATEKTLSDIKGLLNGEHKPVSETAPVTNKPDPKASERAKQLNRTAYNELAVKDKETGRKTLKYLEDEVTCVQTLETTVDRLKQLTKENQQDTDEYIVTQRKLGLILSQYYKLKKANAGKGVDLKWGDWKANDPVLQEKRVWNYNPLTSNKALAKLLNTPRTTQTAEEPQKVVVKPETEEQVDAQVIRQINQDNKQKLDALTEALETLVSVGVKDESTKQQVAEFLAVMQKLREDNLKHESALDAIQASEEKRDVADEPKKSTKKSWTTAPVYDIDPGFAEGDDVSTRRNKLLETMQLFAQADAAANQLKYTYQNFDGKKLIYTLTDVDGHVRNVTLEWNALNKQVAITSDKSVAALDPLVTKVQAYRNAIDEGKEAGLLPANADEEFAKAEKEIDIIKQKILDGNATSEDFVALDKAREKAVQYGASLNKVLAGMREIKTATAQYNRIIGTTGTDFGAKQQSQLAQQYQAAYNTLTASYKQWAAENKLNNPAIQNQLQQQLAGVKKLGSAFMSAAGKAAELQHKVDNARTYTDKFGDEHILGDAKQLSASELTNITGAMQAYAKSLYGVRLEKVNLNTKTMTLTGTLRQNDRVVSDIAIQYNQATDKLYAYQVQEHESLTGLPGLIHGFKEKRKAILQYVASMTSIYRIFGFLKQGIQQIREIDTALTELKKVTDETSESYERFIKTAAKTADKVGSTITKLVNSAADWSRIGYSLEEAATLAESTAVLLNVSEFTNIEDATSALTSTLQAFGYTAAQSMDVVDVLNEVKFLASLYSDVYEKRWPYRENSRHRQFRGKILTIQND